MSIIGSNVLAGASGGAGAADYQIQRSLRFNSADSAYLNRTPSSAGNRKTWTWSGWVKRSELTTDDARNYLFSAPDSGGHCSFYFSADKLRQNPYTAANGSFTTDAVFRDPSAWYHIVYAYDSTQSTATDRIKLYVNGVLQTFSAYSAPTENQDSPFSAAAAHYIGKHATASTYSNFYLADVHFIDGQALAPTDFGEFDDNNDWQPKAFSGTYNDSGQVFSNTLTTDDPSGFPAAYPASLVFNGTLSSNTFVSGQSSTITWDASSYGITIGSQIKVGIYNNYNLTVTTSTGSENLSGAIGATHGFVTFTVTGTLQSITSFGAGSFSPNLSAVEVDGVHLTDTPAGVNGFHLDFSDNSSNAALGYDAAGSNDWTVNNLTAPPSNTGVYASNFVSSNGFNASYPSIRAFDGSTSTYAQATATGGTLTFTPPTGISYSSSIKIYMPSAGATASVNGGSATSVANSSETTIASGSGTLTSLVLTASNLPGLAYIKIDDQILVNTGLDSGTDSLVDTPTNYGNGTGAGGEVRGNYATLNPLNTTTQTLSNGNLGSTGVSGRSTGTIYVSSGKWYWEFTAGTSYTMAGIESSTNTFTSYPGGSDQQYALYGNAGSGQLYHNGSASSFDGFVSGDVIGVALDMDGGNLYFYKNGAVMNSGTAAATGLTGLWTANCRSGSGGYNGETVFNFGQRAFAYAAPSGYKALCTQNLPEPTIADGSAYFDTKLYTGNGGTQTISGLNFSPDFIWLKQRSGTNWHEVYDAIRGTGLRLFTNTTNGDDASTSLTSFNSDGFSLNNTGGGNVSSTTYVAWTWDAGANSSKTYAVTVVSDSGNKYRFDGHGTSAVTLDLEEGSTYTFDQSDSSNAGHPLRFSTTSDGTHGSGSEYTTGVTTVGTPGSAGASTTIVVASGAPTLYYYCSVHSGMGGQINTNSTAGATVLSGSLNSSLYNQSTTWSSNTTSGSTYSSYSWTDVFNGTITGSPNPGNSVVQATGDYTQIAFSSFTSISSVKVVYYGGPGGQIYINYGETSQQLHAATEEGDLGDGVQASHTFTTSELVNLRITNTGSANFPYLYAIYVDGKLLVDSSVSITTPSINSVVRANPTAGFSVVTWDASANATVAHGLNAAPQLVITKSRNYSTAWRIWSAEFSNADSNYLGFDTSAVSTFGGAYWGSMTSTTIGLSAASYDNNYGEMLAYCFAPVEGYSAMGSYTGNGSTDGPFVHTGFRVAFLMVRSTSGPRQWLMFDNTRFPLNGPNMPTIYAQASTVESTTSENYGDFLSNGFKARATNGNWNGNGETYIYIALAENAFSLNGGMAR